MTRPLISVADLRALLETEIPVVVDCRFSLSDGEAGRRAYDRAHLPGAVYAHLERDLSAPVVPGKSGRHPWPDSEQIAKKLGSWGVSSGTMLVAYDYAGGAFAARLWAVAIWLGHDRSTVLDGGHAAWTAEGLPVTSEVPLKRAATFEPRIRDDFLVDAVQVEHLRTRADFRLFDARAEARFRGDVEPIDPVAGHIPGARSFPFEHNLEAGHMRQPEEVRSRLLAELEGTDATHSVAYCGSGVTACHLVLAAAHAGLDGMRLYPGSWSEWITDPRRPVARGDAG
jgi:thiosulfate/3-mercaptopyruvate sulfurtransferase